MSRYFPDPEARQAFMDRLNYIPPRPTVSAAEAISAAQEMEKWHPMDTAPRDGSTILGKYGSDEALICWLDRPVCMLGSVNGGHPPGWATPVGGDTDSNLPMDAPEAWREIEPDNDLDPSDRASAFRND